jgi:nitroreductase
MEAPLEKPAPTQRPIHDLIRNRWSPRAFASKPVDRDLLTTLLEAARWAPSCFNEQPWCYAVATSQEGEAHARACSVLTEGNAWARSAPVLVLSLARPTFTRNGKPNPHGWHDLGAASENLCLEAVNQGLAVHQMAGFQREKAREVFAVPAEWEPVAMMAIGYPGSPEDLPEGLRERETAARRRKPPEEMAFGGRFGEPFGP